MTNWLRLSNPMVRLDSREAALTVTRLSALGMVIGAVRDTVLAVYSTSAGAEATREVVETVTSQPYTPEQMHLATQLGLAGAVAVIVLQLVLAVVQWRKPTSFLPLIFLVLVVWALGSSLLALINMPVVAAAGGVSPPLWLITMTLVCMSAAALLHINSIRAAAVLAGFHKLTD
jgi:hypothetical protein